MELVNSCILSSLNDLLCRETSIVHCVYVWIYNVYRGTESETVNATIIVCGTIPLLSWDLYMMYIYTIKYYDCEAEQDL
jgi:hypothetical protein